jgi:CBS domain-containing protein
MKVKQIMHKGVQWVSPNTPVTTLAKEMLEQDIGAVPVGENDRLIGMVTDRDITLRALANGKDISKLTASDVMSKGVTWCRDSDDVNQAARLLPVIDENKRLVGMLSLGDISQGASQRITTEVIKAVSAHHA